MVGNTEAHDGVILGCTLTIASLNFLLLRKIGPHLGRRHLQREKYVILLLIIIQYQTNHYIIEHAAKPMLKWLETLKQAMG